ncbi:MAG: 6-bladed beta-propeller [Bacteroidales bacterium]
MKPITTTTTITTFLTILLLLLTSCQTSKKPQTDLITIDIIPALNNFKEFRLSELVDSIEYVKLETKPECLISSASRVIGKKYILLLNGQPPQVLLFDRSGKFLRLIGKIGKGPGEYTFPLRIDISPDEDRIIVFDFVQKLFLEYSMDGSFISSYKAPFGMEEGPYYLDQHYIVFMQSPLSDSLHYPRVIAMNLETGEQKALYFFNYKRNPNQGSGVYLKNDFYRTDEGIVFKDALCDTIYRLLPDFSVKPIYSLNSFTNKAIYYSMTEQVIDAVSRVALACFTPQFLFLLGNDKERFHLVYNSATKETFRLPEIKECRGDNDYSYGIVNDLDGTGPFWFWNGNIRNSITSNQFQIVDLKELIKTDCFTKADLKTNQYRDQLKKLVEESSENDNPIIRIMHLRKLQTIKNK